MDEKGPAPPPFVALAVHLADEVERVLAEADPSDYPATVLTRLLSQALTQYRGILALSIDWATIGAAEVLTRSLLECHAQVGWITDSNRDSKHRTIRCRSLCYELALERYGEQQMRGVASSVEVLVTKLEELREAQPEELGQFIEALQAPIAGVGVQTLLGDLPNREGPIAALHRAEGCRCRGGGRDVIGLLKRTAGDDPLAAMLWMAFSNVAHHALPPLMTQMNSYGGALVLDRDMIQCFVVGYPTDLIVADTQAIGQAIGFDAGVVEEVHKEFTRILPIKLELTTAREGPNTA